MKIVGIGDLLIPENFIKSGFLGLEKMGHRIETVQWKLENYEELQNINLLVETHGSEAYEPSNDVLQAVQDADVIITQFCPITKRVIDSCKNLKMIGVLRGGYENINVKYATEKEIIVCNTPGRNADAVADFAVGMILSECRNIAKSHRNLKEGKWVRDYSNAATVPDLPGNKAGIIGLGAIGRKVARRLRGFDMEIMAYDPYVKEVPDYVELVSLEKLMRECLIVTLHTRLSASTEHMINAEVLRMMRPDAYLINTARSGLVDEKALYEVLKAGKIAGAALDVFDVEPPLADYPLITLPNVTVTPHLAGGTVDAFTRSPKLLAKEMETLITEKDSRFVVNKEIFSKVIEQI